MSDIIIGANTKANTAKASDGLGVCNAIAQTPEFQKAASNPMFLARLNARKQGAATNNNFAMYDVFSNMIDVAKQLAPQQKNNIEEKPATSSFMIFG